MSQLQQISRQHRNILCLVFFLVIAQLAGCGGGTVGPMSPVNPCTSTEGGRHIWQRPNAVVADQPGQSGKASIQVSFEIDGCTEYSGLTDASGNLPNLPDIIDGSTVFLTRSNGNGTNVYRLTVSQNALGGIASLYVNPIAAVANVPNNAVSLSPPSANPGGAAFITAPKTGETVSCNSASSPGICRFNVTGIADKLLGQPNNGYHTYLLVQPINPNGQSGWFVQFEEIAVDPGTGNWSTEGQVGPNIQSGAVFQITVVVTTVTLPRGTAQNPTQYPAPDQVPGVVFIAPFASSLKVGSLP